MDVACHTMGKVQQILIVGAANDALGRAIDNGSGCEQQQRGGADKGL